MANILDKQVTNKQVITPQKVLHRPDTFADNIPIILILAKVRNQDGSTFS